MLVKTVIIMPLVVIVMVAGVMDMAVVADMVGITVMYRIVKPQVLALVEGQAPL